MKVIVPYSSRVEEFACHSPACAPPPVGSGGSSQSAMGAAFQTMHDTSRRQHAGLIEKIRVEHEAALAVNRANRAAPLTHFQQHTLDRIAKTGSGGATQSDAKGLVSRGLIERISGKGRGQGNTPQWKLTAKGKEATRGPEPTIPGKALPRAIRMGPPGTKEHTVHGETETHYKLGGYTVAKAGLKPHMILD